MENPQKKHKNSFAKFIIFLILALLLILFLNSKSAAQAQQENSAAIVQAANEASQQDQLSQDSVNLNRLLLRSNQTPTSEVDTTKLDETINSIVKNNSDIIFGITISDLNTDLVYDYANQEAMTAASVTKVLTSVDYLKQVELGNRSLGTVMVNGLTAQQCIEQMIVVSDNFCWEALNENLTYSQMQSYAESIGLVSYDYSYNVISANDTAQLLADLYKRKLINESNTQMLLSYMERANYRDLIVPAVPENDTVYHKAGEYLINLNDAAIIKNDQNAIVISIFTESTATYSKSRVAEIMQQITAPAIETFGLN